jgi:hypothetical protein
MQIRETQKKYGSGSGSGCGFGPLVHLHNSSKINIIKKLQNSRNQGFFLLLLDDGRIRICIRIRTSDPGGPKHADTTDPDTQHYFFRFNILLNSLKCNQIGEIPYLLALESWDRLSLSAAVSPSLKLENLGYKNVFRLLAKKLN